MADTPMFNANTDTDANAVYAAKICCADLYASELARLILGDSLHPGGLRATNRLGRALGLQAGWRVLDVACGLGVSAAALSRVFRCQVVGLELGATAALDARRRTLSQPVPANAVFVRGDAEMPPFRDAAFDAVIVECAASLFPDKAAAVAEIRRMLRPGGVVGISDVTVETGSLPPELDGTIGMMLCLADALPADGYANLLQDGGFTATGREDWSGEVLSLLAELRGKLALGQWAGAAAEMSDDLAGVAPGLLERVDELVRQGQIGYWLYTARKGE